MAKQKKASQTSMSDMVGRRSSSTGEPKKFFGQLDKVATGKDNDGNLTFANAPDPTNIGNKLATVPTLINEKSMLELESKTKAYNAKVKDLNPKYKELTPLHKIIVRCYVLETTRTNSGIIIPPKVIVDIPTNNGVGKLGEVDSPFPYDKKAVIVSVPPSYSVNENSKIKPGQELLLSKSPLKVVSSNKEGTLFDMPDGFTHPDWKSSQLPKDMDNEHYGYLLVSIRDIEILL